MKICNECNQEKDFSEFLQRKDSKDGYRKNCKKCFYAKNEPKKKEYYLLNREKIKENSRNREKYRKETDVIFRLENQISSSIRMSLKNFGYKKIQGHMKYLVVLMKNLDCTSKVNLKIG